MFQKKADQTFEGLPGVVAIADEYLDNVMKRTHEVDLCQDKSVVKSHRIKFVGNYHSSNGLEPGPDKIAAIDDMATPKYSQELQNVLGMVNYLSCYTPDLVIPAASTTVTSTRTS